MESIIKGKKSKVWIEYLVLCILVLIGLTYVLELWKADLFKYPLAFSGDATQVQYLFRQILETGIFGVSKQTSYPFFSYVPDFMPYGYTEQAFRWVLCLILGNAVAASNIYYLAGYFLAAVSAHWALKKLGISTMTSMTVALLYSFTPYHFLRGMYHLGYSFYWWIPIFLYFMIRLVSGKRNYFQEGRKLINRENIFHLIIMFYIGGTIVYYTYLSCFFICLAIMLMVLRREKLRHIGEAIVDFVVIMGSFILNTIIPFAIKVMLYGSNNKVAVRSGWDVEAYALKIGQLLMPIQNHRISLLANIKELYNKLPLTTENNLASLGFFVSVGFILLLIDLLLKKEISDAVHACAMMNLGAVLLATIGGVASMISLVFTKIRCYNRISIYIAFFAAVALATVMDLIGDKIKDKIKQPVLWYAVCAIVLVLGVLDQTSASYVPNYEGIKNEWDVADEFVKEIEGITGEGAKIYEMPYLHYPECRNELGFRGYTLSIGYLHSKTLHWTYGCYEGRKGDLWNTHLIESSLEDQINEVIQYGFDGIFLFSEAYEPEKFDALIKDIEEMIGTAPIKSANGEYYFFDLAPYREQLTKEGAYGKDVYFEYYDGFYQEEHDETHRWIWCSNTGRLIVVNPKNENTKMTFSAVAKTLNPEGGEISVTLNKQKYTFTLDGTEKQDVSFTLEMEPGVNIVAFQSDIPAVQLEKDARYLSFRLNDFCVTHGEAQ